jgi:hypothetical protein
MSARHPINWRLRLGLLFSFIVGAGWGFVLGVIQIRLNAWLSPWLVLGVAMPLAFAGSMITGLVFNRMILTWHKVARVLIALVVVVLATPFGLVWGLFENGYNPAQLMNETGAMTWNLEWLIAIAGLFAGMWPLWTVPLVNLFGRFMLWVLAVPLAFVRWIGERVISLLSPIARLVGSIASAPANGATRAVQPRAAPPPAELPAPVQTSPRRTRRASILRRMRPRQAKPVAANGNNHNGLRVGSVVEERCPYCFDVIKRNDPRGVHVCDVCGTPHHADCWSITGKCQVPHLNT